MRVSYLQLLLLFQCVTLDTRLVVQQRYVYTIRLIWKFKADNESLVWLDSWGILHCDIWKFGILTIYCIHRVTKCRPEYWRSD